MVYKNGRPPAHAWNLSRHKRSRDSHGRRAAVRLGASWLRNVNAAGCRVFLVRARMVGY